MPQSIEALALTTVALAIAVAATTFFLARYPGDPKADSLVILWRRLAGTHTPAPKKKAKKKPRPKAKPKPKPKPKAPPVVEVPQWAAAPVVESEPVVEPEPEPAKETIEPEPEPEPADEPEVVPTPEPAAKPKPKPPRKRKPVIVRAVNTDTSDHVPLSTEQSGSKPQGEPKLLIRQRFRRGLSRTRERLGAEMREAFTGGATPEAFDQIEEALVAADVGMATATAVTEGLREEIGLSDKTLPKVVRDAMVGQLQDADRRLRLVRGRLSVWVVVGVNGTGKTTTIAKLAARSKDLGVPVCLAAADTFRAAAVEQLAEWGRRLGITVVQQGQGADPGAVVFDAIAHAKASGARLLIVDTAGRLHTRKPLMDELQKVFRVIERESDAVVAECLLTIDATTGQNGIAQAKAFKDAVNITGLVLAKLDGTAKGGIVFAVEKELGVPVKAVGVGEKEKDLVPFEPGDFVDALIGAE